MSFFQRAISFTFELSEGTFAASGTSTLEVTGLRASVEIDAAGGPYMGEAHIRIWGLTTAQLNDLSFIQRNTQGLVTYRRNFTVTVAAGNKGTTLPAVFLGQIISSNINLNSQPDTLLEVVAQAGQSLAAQKVPASSFPGRKDAMGILATLAATANPPLAFENSNGLSVIVSDQYLRGSLFDQVQQVAQAAQVEVKIDLGTLAVWPRGGVRKNGAPLVVSPQTGMVGYPTNEYYNLTVDTEFNPQLYLGQQVQVQSSLQFANGTWGVFAVNHSLESEMPDGKWFSNFRGYPVQL